MTEMPTDDAETTGPGEPRTSETAPTDTAPTDSPSGPPPLTGQPHWGPPAAPRRLYRSTHDRQIGGVAGGIAEYFGLDPTVVRLITLVLAVGTGIGIVLYFVAWAVVPERPEGVSPYGAGVANYSRIGTQSVAVAAGVGAIVVAASILSGSWFVLAFALMAGGVWLLTQQGTITQRGTNPSVAPNATPSGYSAPLPQPATRWASDFEPPAPSATQPGFASFAAPAPPAGSWPVPKQRKPQTVTRVVFSLLALLLGAVIALELGDWWDPGPTRYLGLAILVIGVGVVVGQVRGGGARGLIPLGIVMALALLPVSALDGVTSRGIGERDFRPTGAADLQPEYEHGIGELTVDLSDLDLADVGRQEIDIDLGIGRVEVIVPPSLGGLATIEAGLGEISYPLDTNRIEYDDGVGVDSGRITLGGEDGELELNIRVGIGSAAVRQAEGS